MVNLSLLDHLNFVVFFVLISTAITYLVLINIPAKYESTSTVYVTQNTPTQTLDNSVLTVSTQFAGTFSQLGQTQSVIDEVGKKVDENIDPSQIIITTEDNTQLVKVTARDRDPKKAAKIANILVAVLKDKISDLQFSISPENRAIIQISEKATPNYTPVSPKVLETLLGGIILWSILAYFLVYLADSFDNGVKDESDVALVDQSLAILGKIPLAKNKKSKKVALESFRELRTNLLYSSPDKKLKLIAVSSANDGEGKTYIALELAKILASADNKVLLVDADLRRHGLSRRLILKSGIKVGATEALNDGLDINQTEIKKIATNLDILPVGRLPHNPGELFSQKKSDDFFDKLRKNHDYDVVIIDTPPIEHVNDAVLISAKVDGVVLVVQAGRTSLNQLKSTLSSLNNVSSNLLGVVLNQTKKSRNRNYGIY